MLRKKLEPKIDFLLGEKLREPEFLSRVVDEFNVGTQNSVSTLAIERTVVGKKLADLEAKRQRILEAFFDGAIDKQERDSRIVNIDSELSAFRQILLDSTPVVPEVRTESRSRLRGNSRTVLGMGIFRARRQARAAHSTLS
jgi:hypothetical protein